MKIVRKRCGTMKLNIGNDATIVCHKMTQKFLKITTLFSNFSSTVPGKSTY